MPKAVIPLTTDLLTHFRHVDDPRTQVHSQWHRFEDILLLTIFAALCGADT